MDYFVKTYGAVGDGIHNDTDSIQAAINACSERGGGRVLLEAGTYRTGTLYMRDHVELFIDHGAVLKGSERIEDYADDTYKQLYRNESHMDKCLIYCEHVHHIAFSGSGCLDGSGEWFRSEKRGEKKERPMLIRMKNCENIRMKTLHLRNPASWTTNFIACNHIWIENLNISSRVNGNGDGLDFNACQDVFISGCRLDCSDDCICLQNSEETMVCKNIVVTNCILYSKWAGMRIGLLSCGDIENVTVSNCIFRDISCSAIKIQSAEGGQIKKLFFENLIMEEVQRPLFVTQNYKRERIERPEAIERRGLVKDLHIHNVIATAKKEGDAGTSCMILDAQEKGGIQNIRISNGSITVTGGGKRADNLSEIPSHQGKRAECFNYGGQLPAYGLFSRNAERIWLDGFEVTAETREEREKVVGIQSDIRERM